MDVPIGERETARPAQSDVQIGLSRQKSILRCKISGAPLNRGFLNRVEQSAQLFVAARPQEHVLNCQLLNLTDELGELNDLRQRYT
jgi:hypothetical protein